MLKRLAAAATMCAAGAAGGDDATRPTVEIVTSLGAITIELWPSKAPQTVDNFLRLVEGGFYEGTIFHRVIAGFVIQAGGYDADLNYRSPPRTVVNESANGERNLRWTVAMARHADPNSADAQFFVNMAEHNPHLDASPAQPGYTVFGKLIAGHAVAEQIELAEKDPAAHQPDLPLTPITILEARKLPSKTRPSPP